ncbi:hypothetical protein CVT24_012203, partial [Panaeolus cyanescens]
LELQQNYNPVSATWDLIRDAKIANEELLTLGLPQEFDVLYRYARGLEFDDLPDYEGLRRLFRGLAERVGIEYDGVFDWSVKEPGNGKEGDVTAPGDGGGKGAGNPKLKGEDDAAAGPHAHAMAALGKGRRTVSEGGGSGGRRYCAACNARNRR